MSRVGFVLPSYPRRPVGGYRVVYFYASAMAAHGHDVTIYHANVFDEGASSDPLTGGRGARFGPRPGKRVIERLVTMRAGDSRPDWFPFHDDVQVRNVARLSVSSVSDRDVLVATAVRTAPFVTVATQAHGTRGVYFIQSFEDWDAPREYVEATWRLPLTRVVIAPWLQDLGMTLGVQTELVRNAIDPTDMPPGPPLARRPTDVLALVSKIPGKRTDLVIEVMKRLTASVEDFRGVTFGLCRRPAGLPQGVMHVKNPPRAQLSSLYRDTKIYLCTSDAEGWHLPPAEAMASGAAVVSTDIGGVRAYASDATAVFAPVGDSAGLTEGAVGLLRNPKRCAEIAAAGQRDILEYGPQDAASRFAEAVIGR